MRTGVLPNSSRYRQASAQLAPPLAVCWVGSHQCAPRRPAAVECYAESSPDTRTSESSDSRVARKPSADATKYMIGRASASIHIVRPEKQSRRRQIRLQVAQLAHREVRRVPVGRSRSGSGVGCEPHSRWRRAATPIAAGHGPGATGGTALRIRTASPPRARRRSRGAASDRGSCRSCRRCRWRRRARPPARRYTARSLRPTRCPGPAY